MAAEYIVTGQQHVNRYLEGTGTVERGWWITYRDPQTGVTDQVWLREHEYPDKVRETILAELSKIRFVHGPAE